MKTAISIPDETFTRAQQHADDLGLSRSEFFTRAVQCYIESLDAASTTRLIDAAIDLVGEDDSARFAVDAGRRRLLADHEEW